MSEIKISSYKKNKKAAICGVLFFMILLLTGCKTSPISQLKNGDLLFVTAKETGLSGAINNVTQKEKKASFDHIGMLEKDGSKGFVLHAAPKGGSQKQAFEAFMKDRRSDGQRVVVYRLKPEYQKAIPVAIEKANSMLGRPYNFTYILDENSYYCSDFVERVFREDHIFKLEPMTFIDPKTGKTNTFWEEFYISRNLKVPEGEPGCNPNGLAGSDKLERITEL
ncbi:YiiX/YebB-like N1pC/P60 family cysteine hydrolase [Chryseobacterium indologenes]|uniref:YiiX/YebB-like N1pC/P60 family cysteine hydrolase n=1 Tax=Chryseobacterium indologenes TaxID=253 RepID=UPI0016294E0A|nr:YiiX/YebB-like N1pC/P60 family cysteine hydrolase [Chryseobacterium indologenes]